LACAKVAETQKLACLQQFFQWLQGHPHACEHTHCQAKYAEKLKSIFEVDKKHQNEALWLLQLTSNCSHSTAHLSHHHCQNFKHFDMGCSLQSLAGFAEQKLTTPGLPSPALTLLCAQFTTPHSCPHSCPSSAPNFVCSFSQMLVMAIEGGSNRVSSHLTRHFLTATSLETF